MANAAAVEVKRPKKKKGKKPERTAAEMTLVEVERMVRKYRRRVCSEPWVEAVVFRAERYAPDVPCKCPQCAGIRRWPRGYVGASGVSYECFLDQLPDWQKRMLPGSTSSVSLARLKASVRAGRNYGGGF